MQRLHTSLLPFPSCLFFVLCLVCLLTISFLFLFLYLLCCAFLKCFCGYFVFYLFFFFALASICCYLCRSAADVFHSHTINGDGLKPQNELVCWGSTRSEENESRANQTASRCVGRRCKGENISRPLTLQRPYVESGAVGEPKVFVAIIGIGRHFIETSLKRGPT